MDFLNTNFTFLNDLESLDQGISKLENARTELLETVRTRSTGEDEAQLPKVDNSSVNSPNASRLLEALEVACSALDDAGLSELKREYGDLDILNHLYFLLAQKEESRRFVNYLGAAEELNNRILSLGDNLGHFESVYAEITALSATGGSDLALIPQIHESLTQAFDEKVLKRKERLQSELETVLSKVKWLEIDVSETKSGANTATFITSADYGTIQESFHALIQLQAISRKPTYPNTWWAVDTLVNPFVLRFQYHFMTPNKKTNKLSKPEWCFEYMKKFLVENLALLELTVGTEKMAKEQHRIFSYEVITSLLVPVRQKMVQSSQQINSIILQADLEQSAGAETGIESEVGRFLSHLIFEMSIFDQKLRNDYKYNPYIDLGGTSGGEMSWLGLTGDIMVNKENNSLSIVASNWLNFESQLANKRFQTDILGSQNYLDIDYDFKENNTTTTTKPTYSAYNLTKLLENLTNHFRAIKIPKYQLKYVSAIELELLDLYVKDLTQQFKKLKLQSVLNFIPGSAKTQNIAVINEEAYNNLSQLCQLYCSSKFLIDKMEYWSEELIFIQVWECFKQVNEIEGEVNSDLSIFDDTVETYKKFNQQVVERIEDFLIKEIRSLLKRYVNEPKWDSLGNGEEEDLRVSIDLGPFMNILPSYLRLLHRSHSLVDFYIASNKVCSALSKTFREFVITNNKFTKNGVDQLNLDLSVVYKTLEREIKSDEHKQVLPYDIKTNQEYIKVLESMDLLESVSVGEISLFGSYDTYPLLRERFQSGLASLSDFEVYDLLHRIK